MWRCVDEAMFAANDIVGILFDHQGNNMFV